MEQALSARIDQEQDRHSLTLDALAEVDAGRVINHKAVQDWADSLSDGDPTQRLLR
ncbi:CopG family transcriptional regulator [Pseudomonas sp. GLN_6]|jgi:predicted transcriptional regulator|uniref:CopG family transcriptional regulator n=1 Tax=Pseudomonas spirodelae TaxID=3101751 RepID=A0ABU5P7D7_9PSED|nr:MULTISPECIES: CopG family transcriptional regulator [unclassified Pseudomonas]PKM27392.1 MAG: CopG family transcriptional regulator [Gammaproteobacteria bacterium HGW-Gammaproteobacteria-13]MCR4508065.1 CopG family transcriptional regulator [Pseudomonas sp. 32.2.56]MDD2162696.1 CopG family transcriptional regulator [Pseudomonas sp. MIL19]MDP2243170.1 CopG family transcriptional regulator [Pseudomonas sp.]MEA1605592.1 CopG family transcriptional regulator [Pseudomonas sp. T5W1]